MVVRLGFAVATALAPDVLITDEVLAVGDESFQKKCIAWMERYLAGGGTLLLCSHSMYHVQKLCRSALWLKDGRVERYGPAADVTQAYLAFHEEKSARAKRPIAAAQPRRRRASTRSSRSTSSPRDTIAQGDELRLSGEVFSPDGRAPNVLIGIVRADGTPVYGVATDMDGVAPHARRAGPVRVRADVAAGRAPAGQVLGARARARSRKACACSTTSSARFVVTGDDARDGLRAARASVGRRAARTAATHAATDAACSDAGSNALPGSDAACCT